MNSVSVENFIQIANAMKKELSKVIVGQEELVHNVLITLFAGGHALLEGVPGLGKTLLIRTLSQFMDGTFSRIQFTPDLMPADIIGTVIISETPEGKRELRFEKGPIFAHLVLADEINRATPRTQSALLEAMQENHVTVSGTTYALPRPFFVLATQNPIEMEGTYPLPEAQLDRFLYKIEVPYPSEEELIEIVKRTTGVETPTVQKIIDMDTLMAMQQVSKEPLLADNVVKYAARIIEATHPQTKYAIETVNQHVRVGASPRGIQAMIRAAKVEALLDNRKAVSIDDIRKVALTSLRHRIVLNFEAIAEGVQADTIIKDILKSVAVPS